MPLVLLAVSVTAGMLLRSSAAVLPWLKITIPTAPAAAAFSALSRTCSRHAAAARCSLRGSPHSRKPGTRWSRCCRCPTAGRRRDRPGDITAIALGDRSEVGALDVGDRVRRHLLKCRGADGLEREVVERLDLGVVAGGPERLDDVVDR